MSGQAFEERAEQELRSARTPFQLAKARELAAHWRWRAKAVNPRQYGERVDMNTTMTVREVSDSELIAKMAEFGVVVPMLGSAPTLVERVEESTNPPFQRLAGQ